MVVKKVKHKVERESELGARRAVLEDLFYDINKSRAQNYKMNFFRGLFFGLGSVLGATIVVAFVIWLLSLLADIPGGFGDFIQYIVDTVQKSQQQ
jgi:F0F1-type ATP synthase membrane subunit a